MADLLARWRGISKLSAQRQDDRFAPEVVGREYLEEPDCSVSINDMLAIERRGGRGGGGPSTVLCTSTDDARTICRVYFPVVGNRFRTAILQPGGSLHRSALRGSYPRPVSRRRSIQLDVVPALSKHGSREWGLSIIMGAESVVIAVLPYATAIPIALAVCGGITTEKLRRAVIRREGERDVVRVFFHAINSRNWRTARDVGVVCGDFAAMITLFLMVAVSLHDGATRPESMLLFGAMILQGGLALMAYKFSRDIISHRPENGREPGERLHSWNQSGSLAVSSSTAEKQPMSRSQSLTRQERAEFVELGVRHYQSLRPEIERSHRGEYIAISVKTGKYTTTEDDAKLKAFADSLGPDDFLWMTRVGSA